MEFTCYNPASLSLTNTGILRDIAGFVPDHHDKVSCNLFASGESCLQFVKNTPPMKHNKLKGNKMRSACTYSLSIGKPKFKMERKEEII